MVKSSYRRFLRQPGLAIIGAGGKGWRIGITVPMLAVNDLVELDPTGEVWRGLVRSVQASAQADETGGLTVRQQVTLEVRE